MSRINIIYSSDSYHLPVLRAGDFRLSGVRLGLTPLLSFYELISIVLPNTIWMGALVIQRTLSLLRSRFDNALSPHKV